MMEMFNEQGKCHLIICQGILVEPAGALSVGALEQFKDDIVGRTVVCLISGSNNDLGRM
jgi:threonine dehydratase